MREHAGCKFSTDVPLAERSLVNSALQLLTGEVNWDAVGELSSAGGRITFESAFGRKATLPEELLAIDLVRHLAERTPGEARCIAHLAAIKTGNGVCLFQEEGALTTMIGPVAEIIRYLQDHYGAPALSLQWSVNTYLGAAAHPHGGGAMFLAPGQPPVELDTHEWLAEQESAYLRAQARPAAQSGAEPAP